MDLDEPRRLLLSLAADNDQDLKELSIDVLGRNHAYLQQYVKRGTPRNLPEEAREKLGKHFKVDPNVFRPGGPGITAVKEDQSDYSQMPGEEAGTNETVMTDLIELDVRAAAGDGLEVEQETIVAYWKMPKSLIEAHTQTHPSGLRLLTVYGDSMTPDYQPGAKVMVDPQDTAPSPPGVFVIWDGLGLVIKRVEVIPHTEPIRVRLMSDNEHYTPYEVTLDEAYIQGRVIGTWKWS